MTLFEQLAALTTETVNPRTSDIDAGSARDIVGMLHAEDRTVADALATELDHIAAAVDAVAEAFRSGGRLIYVGAGTSGRLGIVDASECPPTYGTHPAMVQGIIAGGQGAVFRSVEGAEDDHEEGRKALDDLVDTDGGRRSVGPPDVVCGIAASGRTPFVLGALDEAHRRGCRTVLVTTNPRTVVQPLAPYVDTLICPVVGPEPIAGSTRMKSGTAQKMVLNMITTGAMVRIGKTLGNVMVDLQLTNAKLVERSKRIVMTIGGVDYDRASQLLEQSGGSVKVAIVMAVTGCPREEAESRLTNAHGFVRRAIT